MQITQDLRWRFKRQERILNPKLSPLCAHGNILKHYAIFLWEFPRILVQDGKIVEFSGPVFRKSLLFKSLSKASSKIGKLSEFADIRKSWKLSKTWWKDLPRHDASHWIDEKISAVLACAHIFSFKRCALKCFSIFRQYILSTASQSWKKCAEDAFGRCSFICPSSSVTLKYVSIFAVSAYLVLFLRWVQARHNIHRFSSACNFHPHANFPEN